MSRNELNKELEKTLNSINDICKEWKEIKKYREGRGGWMFSYKLNDLAYKCEEYSDFEFLAGMVLDEWKEAVRRIVLGTQEPQDGEESWDYSGYFEHDNHHGSYFSFKDQSESSGNIDYWSEDIGLSFDLTEGDAWKWTTFEKAIHETYGVTRFSTDKLTPDDYTDEEIKEINDTLTSYVIPTLKEQLNERKEIITAYEDIKYRQCEYLNYLNNEE